ncbi:MAG: hypothetical protein WDO56_13770 [Gammaproteobacteria bacterium]
MIDRFKFRQLPVALAVPAALAAAAEHVASSKPNPSSTVQLTAGYHNLLRTWAEL